MASPHPIENYAKCRIWSCRGRKKQLKLLTIWRRRGRQKSTHNRPCERQITNTPAVRDKIANTGSEKTVASSRMKNEIVVPGERI